jgi:mono/diheme cytochrome c family protein
MKQFGGLGMVLWLGIALVGAVACTDGGDDVGGAIDEDPLALTGGDASLDGGAPTVTYAEVYRVFETHCLSCHGAGKQLDLSTAALARSELINVVAEYKACASDGGTPARIRVLAGDVDASLLSEKLSTTPSCGKPMPPTGPLPAADVALIRAWIAAGAAP